MALSAARDAQMEQKEKKISFRSCSLEQITIHDVHRNAGRRLRQRKGTAMAASLKLIESERNGENMDRQKALEAALAQIDRAFGKGSAMKLGSRETMQIEAISTGSLGLDIALGIGGLPKGRVIEIFGPESSGKTTLALHVIAEAQKKGGTAAFVDAEHALDPVYAKKLGVDIDELIVSQPDTGEQALEIADTLVRSNAIDVLVIDSVAALVPRAEIEGEMGDSHVGLAGPSDEPGAAQAHRLDQPLELHGHLHQPDAHEDRRDVRHARNHDRRQCAQILCLGPARHPPHRPDQGSRRYRRQRHPGEGRQEQGRAAVQAGRIRHHVWRRHFQDRRNPRPRRQGRDRREVGRLVLL